MRVDILSLFPEYFKGPFDVSILKRAREKGIVEINLINIRDFATEKWAKVDDRPFGGGPGMVLMAEPVCRAIRSLRQEESYVIYFSPQGKVLSATMCQTFAKKKHLILLCGHYEGIDERAIELEVDEEISIGGDFVLTSGCPAASCFVDAVLRQVPGVLGDAESAAQDSFQEGIFDAPCYTHPVEFEGLSVPAVLRSGNHKEIAKWKREKAEAKTRCVRPDLMTNYIGETK